MSMTFGYEDTGLHKVGDVLASCEVRVSTWTCPKCGMRKGSHSRAWGLSDGSNGSRMCDDCFGKYRKGLEARK